MIPTLDCVVTFAEQGLALRFPRIKAIRRDKTLADIDTLQTAENLLKC